MELAVTRVAKNTETTFFATRVYVHMYDIEYMPELNFGWPD